MKAGCAAQKLQFEAHGKRDVVADFDGGRMTSDGGGLLLREANCCLGDLMARLGQCVSDFRQQGSVEHTATDLIAQRVCALGYEDLNDHGTLRRDSLLALLAGRKDLTGQGCKRKRDRAAPLASAATLKRFELGRPETAAQHRYHRMLVDRDGLDNLLVDLFLESQAEAPEEIWLDLDATDDPDPHPRGRGVLPRRDPELVRSQCGGLRARAGSQPGADLALTPRHAPGRQSALRGDQPGTLRNPVAAAAVRAGLLRPRRDGEPHQGAAAVSVRRPHQQRDLLDKTLVVWGGEFGRTLMVEIRKPEEAANAGHDHQPTAYSMWMAGGGIKSGHVHGATDGLCLNITKDPVHVHDLQATILHQLGFDHEKFTYRFMGSDFQLTDVSGSVQTGLLA